MNLSVGVPAVIMLAAFAGVAFLRQARRTSREIVEDLRDEGSIEKLRSLDTLPSSIRVGRVEYNFKDPLAKIGLYTRAERRSFRNRRMVWVMLVGLALPLLVFAAAGFRPSLFVPVAIVAGGLSALVHQRMFSNAQARFKQSVEFYLPIVMERVVMAVQAGHDIMSGLRAVLELDRAADGDSSKRDPVSRLMELVVQLTEAGFRFDEALRLASKLAEVPAIKHAFIHIAVAHREGGEIVKPLKELSDATQLFFQESVEESIAKMPVRATIPLVCTFLGLLLCFVTAPILQIRTMAKNAQSSADLASDGGGR